MAKPTVAPKTRAKKEPSVFDERPLEALELAISEAQAAQWLLDDIAFGNAGGQIGGTEIQGWLNAWAIDALKRTLAQGERAVRNLKRAEAVAVLKAAGKAVA